MELCHVVTVSVCFCSLPLVSTSYGLSFSKFRGVRLEENGFSGVVVGVSSDIPENPNLIEIIKEMFVNGSSDLYYATKRRAYFREVTILIPPTWTGDQWDASSQGVTHKNVDVTITQSRDAFGDGSLDLPYTKQIEGCGKPGVSIYMTSQFLQDYQEAQQLYGNYGKILVHEWGHYRWGLFDEYPDEGTEGKNLESFYFSTETQRWQPVGCSNQWKMVAVKRTSDSNVDSTYITCEGNNVTGYEEGCIALPSARHSSINGSIMEGYLSFQELPVFCDSDSNDPSSSHNSEAPNRQNLECGGRSAWGVMRDHEDFNDGKNLPRNITNLTPKFNIIRVRPPRVVFVIDNSKEMEINDRMLEVTTAVNCFIKTMIPDGTLVGLVIFGSQAHVLHDLKEVDSNDSTGKFDNWLQDNISGDTDSSVERGVTAALKMLSQQNDNGGGKVVLITAAEGGNSTLTGVAEGQYTREGIVIDALIYNDDSADIFDIVDSTGGKVYLQTNSGGVEGLLEALYDVISGTGLKPPLRTQVLMDPMNDGYREEGFASFCSANNDDVTPEFSFMPLSVYTCPVEVSVRINWDVFSLNFTGVKPFAIYAEVLRCEDPIVDVKVMAIIERPIGTDSKRSQTLELTLLDNGAGADLRRHDGVYSRYFTEFTGPGIYGITVKANNHGTAKVFRHLRNRFPRSYVNAPFFAEDLLSGNYSSNETDVGHFLFPPSYDDLEGETLHNFTVGTTGGATRVTNSSPSGDVISPAKITDLSTASKSTENETVTLTFTAPGDDLDYGYALRYDFYISNTREQLINNASSSHLIGIEDIIVGNVFSPSESGTVETFVVRVHLPSGIETVSYYIGVIAEDDAGNRGEMSTLAPAVFQNLTPAFSPGTASTEPAFTTTLTSYSDTGTSTESTTLTSQFTSVTVLTTSKSPPPIPSPHLCQRLDCTCIVVISLATLLFVTPLCVLIISLLIRFIIHKRRKCSKVGLSIEDIEITEQSTTRNSNRT